MVFFSIGKGKVSLRYGTIHVFKKGKVGMKDGGTVIEKFLLWRGFRKVGFSVTVLIVNVRTEGQSDKK